MAHRTPSQDRARRFVLALVRSARASGRTRLPTIAEMALQAGVSQNTMWKAVAGLRVEGVLLASQKRGIHVTDTRVADQPDAGGQDTPSNGPHLQKWEQVRERVREELRQRHFAPGAVLPAIKELRQRYGVCYRTLKKALESLTGSGLLEPYKKTYRVPSLLEGRRHTVVLVSRGSWYGSMLWTPRSQENLRALESEGSRVGLRLAFENCSFSVMERNRAAPGHIAGRVRRRHREALGYLVWTLAMERAGIPDILEGLLPAGRPISVFDETGGVDYPRELLSHRQVRVFTASFSPRCGHLVGRYLLGLGHRRVAYLSPFHRSQWSVNRLAGLRAAFVEAGIPDAVRSFTATTATDFTQAMGRLHSLHDNVHSLFSTNVRDVQRSLERVKGHIADFGAASSRLRTDTGRTDLFDPLLESLLTESDATAIVCGNDTIAVECLHFMQARGKHVPDDYSVIGFDNTPEASYRGLTSFSFNGSAVMHAMLAHVTGTPWPLPHRREATPIEIDGFVVERGSSAPLRPRRERDRLRGSSRARALR